MTPSIIPPFQACLRPALALLALFAAPAAAIAAPAPPIRFDIPAGPLGAALLTYAAQSRQQLLFDRDLVAGRTTNALSGVLSADAALDQLLAGTGVVVIRSSPGVVVLRRRRVTSAPPPQASSDPAPPAAAETAVVDELVVTGSLIRGAASGPAPVISISRDAMDRAGHATLGEALQALPQTFGGTSTPQGELLGSDGLGVNLAASTGVNLRGLGANSTLVLVDGRRVAGAGIKGDFADVSAIAAAAVDHVEILLDGTSALYGSDAVGGVVNIILRKDFSGAETRVRYGAARGGDNADLILGQTFGRSWSGGRLVVSYEYEDRDPLRAADRTFTASADLRPLGGSDHRLPYSHPANLLAFDPDTGSYLPTYGVRPGQSGANLQPSDFLVGHPNLENVLALADVIPSQTRHSLYLNLDQRISPRVEVGLDAHYGRRSVDFRLPGALGIFAVTPADPFYATPDGAQSELIGYAFGDEFGPIRNRGSSESFGATLSANVDFARTWRLDLSASLGQEASRLASSGLLNSGYLDEALGNTPDDPATAYSAARDGYFNPYGDGGANGPAVLAFIGSGTSLTRAISRERSLDAKADGSVLALPGGEVKLAVGGQIREGSFHTSTQAYVYGPDPYLDNAPLYHRTIAAAFAELRIPLIGTANRLPLAQSVDVSLAGRIEHYSDAGLTGDPQIGVSWKPIADLKLRATYGTSFRAPGLTEIDAAQNLSPAFVNRGSDQVLALLQYGGNPDLKPETANTWTVGGDLHPRLAPGLTLSATWFEVAYRHRIGAPVNEDFEHALSDPSYAPFVSLVDPTHNPSDLARVQALLSTSPSASAQPFPATAYGAIIDARYVNASTLEVSGLDVTAAYTLTRDRDRFDLAFNAAYLANYRRRLTSASPAVDLVGQPGQPADLKFRVSGSWSREAYGATLGVNFIDGSRDPDAASVAPYATVDLQLQWSPKAGADRFGGLTLALTAQNLLDADPPFYDSPRAVGYDPANTDGLGRVLSLQLTKRW